MHTTFVIIAKDEADAIADLVRQLGRQTLFELGGAASIVVVANGCTDDTAAVARQVLGDRFGASGTELIVHETPVAGKARAWNRAVHELVPAAANRAVFLDADIELADDDVLARLIGLLEASPRAVAVSGFPMKDIAKKADKSLIDRFSLRISAQTPALHAINGSLYAARMEELRRIWLPVPTPGEDGMLTAMITTEGFSAKPDLLRIERMPAPTHYFAAHGVRGFFRHERRMTVGTAINGWLCEHFWAGRHARHVGPIVAERNDRDPGWVDRLVAEKVAGRRWPLPSRLLTWRLANLEGLPAHRMLMRAPFSLAATVLNLWPAIQANRTLRRRGSASYW